MRKIWVKGFSKGLLFATLPSLASDSAFLERENLFNSRSNLRDSLCEQGIAA